MFAYGSSMDQKCSNYALTNLLFGLCRFVRVIDLLVILPNPILELQHAPLPVNQGVYPNSSFFCCVHLGLTFESIKELGGVYSKAYLKTKLHHVEQKKARNARGITQ
jgi:hypothetical protein